MRISLISLFLLITSVAIMLWGLGKAAYYRNEISHAAFIVPRVASDELSVTSINVDDFVISVGGSSYARVSVIEETANGSKTTLQQCMKQGNFTVHLIHTASNSQKFEYGFWLDGKNYVATDLKLNHIKFKWGRSGLLKNGQQLVLLEASGAPLDNIGKVYWILVEAVDIWKSNQKANPTHTP